MSHNMQQYLESSGYVLKNQGRTLGSCRCPRCGEGDSARGNRLCLFTGKDKRERWFCHACQAKGDLADLMALIEGIPLKQALARLRSPASAQPHAVRRVVGAEVAVSAPAVKVEDGVSIERIKPVIADLKDKLPMWEPTVAKLLTNRGISKETIVRAAHAGMIRMLSSNPGVARAELLNAAGGGRRLSEAGLWAGTNSAWPANAFRPLMFLAPGNTSLETRSIKPPSQKSPKTIRLGRMTKPYVWLGDHSRVVVVEGMIDMLSLVEMGEKRTIMALPGASSWRPEWFAAAHDLHGSRFVLALDADDAGEKAARAMAQMLDAKGIEHTRLLPQEGCKDWNDVLLGIKTVQA